MFGSAHFVRAKHFSVLLLLPHFELLENVLLEDCFEVRRNGLLHRFNLRLVFEWDDVGGYLVIGVADFVKLGLYF